MSQYLAQARKYLDAIRNWAEQIGSRPETGFREFETARYIREQLERMGYRTQSGTDIPYVAADLETGRPGPRICVMGEMDAILLDGPVHACGHHIGCAALLAASLLLKPRESDDLLCGSIRFLAVPAEEHIETSSRLGLKQQGIIRHLSGKPELIRRGLFDGTDLAVMVHMMPQETEFSLMTSANGNIIKEIVFRGKAAHAGNAPQDGINALYAANLALNAINALRETFTEEQYARVHPVITKGGDGVNVIPSEVRMEAYVRASSLEHLKKINRRVNTALEGCAHALGAEADIRDIPGYLPVSIHPLFNEIARETGKSIFRGPVPVLGHLGLSSDIGDLSCLMPVMHPFVGGVSGNLHGRDFRVSDPDVAYAKSGAFLASLCHDLLEQGSEKASRILEAFVPDYPDFTTYFQTLESLVSRS